MLKLTPLTHNPDPPFPNPQRASNTSKDLLYELKSHYLSPQEKKLRKETISVFFKPNDLDFYNLNRKNDFNQLNVNKNSTLQEVFLNKKKTEEIFKTVRHKGNIYVNDLWSEDYYKKVMKFAHLQEIIDDIKENQRKRNLHKRAEMLKRIQSNSLRGQNSFLNKPLPIDQTRSFRKSFMKPIVKVQTSERSFYNKKGFISTLKGVIEDCDSFKKEKKLLEKEYKGIKSRKLQEAGKKKKKTGEKQNEREIRVSLMNFFEIKRKTMILQGIPLKNHINNNKVPSIKTIKELLTPITTPKSINRTNPLGLEGIIKRKLITKGLEGD